MYKYCVGGSWSGVWFCDCLEIGMVARWGVAVMPLIPLPLGSNAVVG